MPRILLFLISLAVFSGCAKYPTDSVTTEENDMIISQYDQSAKFDSYQTFAIVDEVLQIRRENGEPEPDSSVSKYSDKIISLIVSNMKTRGYLRVPKDSAPDLGIDVSLLIDENVGSYTYWGGYPGYWGYPGYGYWYPWPTTSYYRYEEGSLVMNMVDLKNRDEVDKELVVIWNNIGVGLVSNSSSYNANRIDRAVEIMFEQSPYVKR